LPTPTPSLPPAPVIPAALLPVKETKILEISPDNDLSKLLTGTLATTLSTEPTPEFFQLAIVKNDLFLGMGDFFKELGVTLPIGFSDSVSPQTEDFTFFLYAKSGENRLGLIVKTSDAAKTSAELKAWELSLPTDLANLFALQGKSGAAAGKFREARYQGVPFRYLSFAEKNLGVCWAIYNDYLILTSSGEGLVRTIDLLKKP